MRLHGARGSQAPPPLVGSNALLVTVFRLHIRSSSSVVWLCCVAQAVMKADALLEEHVLAPAAKHADLLAKAALKGSLLRLDPLFHRMWGTGANAQPGEDVMERSSGPHALTGAL